MSASIALDTNAYRALDDGDKRLADILRTASVIGLPVIVLGELYAGFLGGNKADVNRERLDRLLAGPRVRILHVDEATPRFFGEVAQALKKLGKPIQQDDMWIAALCLQHGFRLATRDRGFDAIPLLGVMPF